MNNTNPNEDDPVLESSILNGFVLNCREWPPLAATTNGDFGPIYHNNITTSTSSSTSASNRFSQPLTLSEWIRAEAERWYRRDQVVNTSTQAVNGTNTYTNSSMSAIPEEESLVLTILNQPAATSAPSSSTRDIYDLSTADWADAEYRVTGTKDDDNDDTNNDEETPLRLESVPRTETEALIAEIGAHSDENIGSDMPRMLEGLLDQQRDEMYAERWRAAGVEGFQR